MLYNLALQHHKLESFQPKVSLKQIFSKQQHLSIREKYEKRKLEVFRLYFFHQLFALLFLRQHETFELAELKNSGLLNMKRVLLILVVLDCQFILREIQDIEPFQIRLWFEDGFLFHLFFHETWNYEFIILDAHQPIQKFTTRSPINYLLKRHLQILVLLDTILELRT